MIDVQSRQKQIKDGLMNYGIDCDNPVDYESIDDGSNLMILVLELDSSDPPLDFNYSLNAKKYLVTEDDSFGNFKAELISIEYLGGVLKWWD